MHLGPLVCHPSVKDIYNFLVNIVEHIDHSLKRLNLLELDKKNSWSESCNFEELKSFSVSSNLVVEQGFKIRSLDSKTFTDNDGRNSVQSSYLLASCLSFLKIFLNYEIFYT